MSAVALTGRRLHTAACPLCHLQSCPGTCCTPFPEEAPVYQERIAALLPPACTIPPRHIEAWMRSEHSTLDALSPARFAAEVAACLDVAQLAGPDMSEQVAQSFGL